MCTRNKTKMQAVMRILILALFCASSSCIQLEGLSTKKPRVTKYTKTTSVPGDPNGPLAAGNLVGPPKPTPSSSALYRVNSTSGATCILLKTDGLLSIKYNNKLGERVEADLYVPDQTQVSGNCRYEDTETMTMVFEGFKLLWNFAKTPGGERWYVSRVQLFYNTNNELFKHVAKNGLPAELGTPANHPALLFPTPVGKSYVCTQETAILLENQNPSSPVDHEATLLLRDFQLQAFMYKAKNAFGPQFPCMAPGYSRDETAPIAVGATLSIVVLGTVTGYGIFRYLKVKKVQYDTME